MGRRHQPLSAIEFDMTPMIDVVFQLIIFFMLITDMTTQDLEVLVLPKAQNAAEDKPDPKIVRPVVNILSDGQILVKREVLYDPANDDQYVELMQFLTNMARRMPKEPIDPKNPGGKQVPANALLIRADQATPFKHIQKVMEVCGREGILIWKIQLAAGEVKKEGEGDEEP